MLNSNCGEVAEHPCVYLTNGDLPFSLPFPLTAGREPVGEIIELGDGISTRKKGDRVGVPFL